MSGRQDGRPGVGGGPIGRIVVVGPGRAGGSLAIAAAEAGLDVVAVVGRDRGATERLAHRVGATPRALGSPLPPADLVVVAVRDDAVRAVAGILAGALGGSDRPTRAIHVSGALPVAALEPLADVGVAVGSLHPLQTLPDPERGAAALRGAWAAVTADVPLADELDDLARRLGLRPFRLGDPAKPLYHAAAATAANYLLAVLETARRLAATAEVPFEAFEPLVATIVENAFAVGPAEALTGPIARGDRATVARQLAAVRSAAPELADLFVALGRATARIAGTETIMEDLWPT